MEDKPETNSETQELIENSKRMVERTKDLVSRLKKILNLKRNFYQDSVTI